MILDVYWVYCLMAEETAMKESQSQQGWSEMDGGRRKHQKLMVKPPGLTIKTWRFPSCGLSKNWDCPKISLEKTGKMLMILWICSGKPPAQIYFVDESKPMIFFIWMVGWTSPSKLLKCSRWYWGFWSTAISHYECKVYLCPECKAFQSSVSTWKTPKKDCLGNSMTNSWLKVLNSWLIIFHILGISSSQLTNSYFSEGYVNHQPHRLRLKHECLLPAESWCVSRIQPNITKPRKDIFPKNWKHGKQPDLWSELYDQ